MSIAVILYGHYRTFDRIYNQWKSLDADFYLTTWDTIASTTKSWYKNECMSPKLSQKNIDILKSFDSDVSILSQSWNTDEMNNIVADCPFKAKLYVWQSILNSISRIEKSNKTYDTVIITRFDIQVNNFKISAPPKNSIYLGARLDNRYSLNLAVNYLFFSVHFDDIHKIKNILLELESWRLNKHLFKYDEEMFTTLIQKYWKVIEHRWNYLEDFSIIR